MRKKVYPCRSKFYNLKGRCIHFKSISHCYPDVMVVELMRLTNSCLCRNHLKHSPKGVYYHIPKKINLLLSCQRNEKPLMALYHAQSHESTRLRTRCPRCLLIQSLVSYLRLLRIEYEPLHQKTNNLHMRKQRRRPASR